MIDLMVLAATVLALVVCVLTHYEAFRALTGVMGRTRVRRRGLIAVLLALILVHSVEISVFAALFALLNQYPDTGGVISTTTPGTSISFFEYFYFSAVVYTTLGFGDLIPHGILRLVSAIEALAGFSLLTWSASFTFLEMQQFWASEDR